MRSTSQLTLRIETERWPLVEPFRVTGYVWDVVETVLVVLEQNGCVGRGETSGVYYKGESAHSIAVQLESVRPAIEAGIDIDGAQNLLPAGGARGALDCALWDLQAQLSDRPVWEMLDLPEPRPLAATFTCSAAAPEQMAESARAYTGARAIKLKLTGEAVDAARVRAVRGARPGVIMRVDANQGFTPSSLDALMPTLLEARVELIEQPFAVGQESLLEGFSSPIPIAADESVQRLSDLSTLGNRFRMVNIKLDKCGGLTEAVAMARAARELGLKTMVGNMLGTSLAMAPGVLLGQICDLVELDGPISLKKDRPDAIQYVEGLIRCPESLWGYPRHPRPVASV